MAWLSPPETVNGRGRPPPSQANVTIPWRECYEAVICTTGRIRKETTRDRAASGMSCVVSSCKIALSRLCYFTMISPSSLLPQISALAQRAGDIALRHFAAPIPTTSKTSRIDIVTAADTEVEAFIVDELTRLFPDHHIVGEEGGGQGAPAGGAAYHWFVDPIDGTVNFASKLPHFCTSIALATADRDPLLGVVYDPTRRELFAAARGAGATLNGNGIRPTNTTDLVDAVIASGFPYDKHTNPDNNLREWTAFTTRVRGERRLGSAALDLCYVASGRLDGYWEKDLKTYDVMAGMLIAREAGGVVTDYAGGAFPQHEDRGRYVASNGRIHATMLAILENVGD